MREKFFREGCGEVLSGDLYFVRGLFCDREHFVDGRFICVQYTFASGEVFSKRLFVWVLFVLYRTHFIPTCIAKQKYCAI